MENKSKHTELTRFQDFLVGVGGGTLGAIINLPFDAYTTGVKSDLSSVRDRYGIDSSKGFWRQYLPKRTKEIIGSPGNREELKTLLKSTVFDVPRKAIGWGAATYAIGGITKALKKRNQEKTANYIDKLVLNEIRRSS